MTSTHGTRVDMHCHSTASEQARLGIQKSIGLPECATPPEEVYELAKARGMDFVTITDHDTIDGCLEIADRPDVFVSEELTARFAGEPQAVHVLCYAITPDDHEFLQAHAPDLETCAAYLHEREITCALAHPFFAVAAPLGPGHRRRLAELFGIWEVRNGSRARELNMPAAVYIDTHGGIGIGGSDDHAGVDIGRTWTETPRASTPEELLEHVRAGRAAAHGEQGSAAKWAHTALALAARVLMREGDGSTAELSLEPQHVLRLAQRVVADGDERGGDGGGDLGPAEGRALLCGWLEAVELGAEGCPEGIVEMMKADGFSHAGLYRRARRIHERRLGEATEQLAAAAVGHEGYGEAAKAIFAGCLPVVPYVPSTAILAKEKAKLAAREGQPRRVGLVVDAAGSMHGVTHTVERIRELGVPGYEVEVIGTDARVDRRLPAVAEVEIPHYAGLRVGVPSVPELVETLADGRYELLHLVAPGPAGIGAAVAARIGGTPLCGSYHTELAAYAGMRAADPRIEAGMRLALSLFYGQCEVVLSPSPASDRSLAALGVDAERIGRWARGVDLALYQGAGRDPGAFPGEVKVLYAGRLSREKGSELLAEAFLRARERDPRLHLLLAGGGPEEDQLRARLGAKATFLGWLGREELARAYASADVFLFCSRTDTYGQVIAEAQASGLAVVAVGEGGPASLIEDRRTGWLCEADPVALAAAVAQLAASPFLRERIARAASESVRGRTWEVAMAQLAQGYDRALGGRGSGSSRDLPPDRRAPRGAPTPVTATRVA
jgi:glycosyltransferase involved in cell wall biosynthesis/predicted metal-dependent phosphoesterase TrpH